MGYEGYEWLSGRVPTNLENLELSRNFVNRKSQGIWNGQEIFLMMCHIFHDLLVDELIFACNM